MIEPVGPASDALIEVQGGGAQLDNERQIGRLAIAKHHARQDIVSWLGEQGGTTQADQAPGWQAYTAARRALTDALNDLPNANTGEGSVQNGNPLATAEPSAICASAGPEKAAGFA